MKMRVSRREDGTPAPLQEVASTESMPVTAFEFGIAKLNAEKMGWVVQKDAGKPFTIFHGDGYCAFYPINDGGHYAVKEIMEEEEAVHALTVVPKPHKSDRNGYKYIPSSLAKSVIIYFKNAKRVTDYDTNQSMAEIKLNDSQFVTLVQESENDDMSVTIRAHSIVGGPN